MTRRTHLFALPALSALLLCGCGRPSSVEKGEAALAKGDYAAAARHFRRAANQNPTAIPLLYNLGAALYRAGDLPGAIGAFHEALNFAPGDAAAAESLAAALREAGGEKNLAESHELLTGLLAFDAPAADRARALSSLSLTERAMKRDDLALAHLLLARLADPSYAPAVYNLARLRADAFKLYPLALQTMQAFKAMPGADAALLGKADDFVAKSRLSAATAQAPRHTTPQAALDFIEQGRDYSQKKRHGPAAEAFDKALAIDPQSYDAAILKANALYAMNRLAEAAEAYGRAADIDGDQADAVSCQAHLAYAVGDNDTAIRALTTLAIPKWPEKAENCKIASYAYGKKGLRYEARAYAELYAAARKAAGAPDEAFEQQWLANLPDKMPNP